MNDSDCRARPGWDCECCSCEAERAGRDTDPAPPPARAELRHAAIVVLDAWVAAHGVNPTTSLFDFCESLL